MTPDTEFYVGGLTDEFTAAAILLLAQDSKLKLDDPVSKYVPEFKLAANVTIAQLLTQTSGLPNYATDPSFNLDQSKTIKPAEFFAAIDNMKPAGAPGAAYEHNPINYSRRRDRRTRVAAYRSPIISSSTSSFRW